LSQGILSAEECLRRVKEELRLEKEAHAIMQKELEELKGRLVGQGMVQWTVACANMVWSSPTMRLTSIIYMESSSNEMTLS